MPAMPPTIYIIDGHAQIFRAYHAIQGGMSSPVTGEPTGAVFAFAGMLMKLYEQYRPEYIVMAIDMPGKTFRHAMDPNYKANRDSPPDDFKPQVERIFEMTRDFGIPLIGVPGAEADDVIATLVKRLSADRNDTTDTTSDDAMNIRVVSRDKDLEQLLAPHVVLFDIHKDETVDVAALQEKKGIRPDQVVDMLALMGDNADNIPGVDKVGPKTASLLINEYGSIAGLLENIDKIKGKRRENIEAARDRLPLNIDLVKLKDDVEFDFDLEASRAGGINAAKLKDLFETLGFRRHIADLDRLMKKTGGASPAAANAADEGMLPGMGNAGNAGNDGFSDSLFAMSEDAAGDAPLPEGYTSAKDFNYTGIFDEAGLDQLIADLRAADLVAFDTETIGLGRTVDMCGLSFAWKEGAGVYIPLISPEPDRHLPADVVLAKLKPLLEDPSVPKTGHNLKYDAGVLQHAGIRLRGIAFDTMLAANFLQMPSAGLDKLAFRELKHAMVPISSLIGAKGNESATMDQVPLDDIVPYAAEDADISLRLVALLKPQMIEADMTGLIDVEMPLVDVLVQMESNGVRVDPDELLRQQTDLTGRIDILRDQIYEAAGEPFNLDSPKQLAEILFTKLGLPVIKRNKSGPSTDVEVLERLADREDLTEEQVRLPKLIAEYRQFAKLVNTYFSNLRNSIYKRDGRIHASFNQIGAATGRLSSGGPNLQNIPIRTDVGRQVRKAFVAEPNHMLVVADYSQIELRILAHLSEDEALTAAFRNDEDIHAAVAAQVFDTPLNEVTSDQRSHAKVINFGIIYGITAYGLSRRIESLDRAGAQKLIDDYRHRFEGIDRFMHQCVTHAMDHGYVATMLGRRRNIPQIASRNPQSRGLGERLAINTVVQGSAADLIKKAMVELQKRIDDDNLPLKILIQVHDELVCEAPAEQANDMAKVVSEVMENAMSLTVPLKAEAGVGEDWLTAK